MVVEVVGAAGRSGASVAEVALTARTRPSGRVKVAERTWAPRAVGVSAVGRLVVEVIRIEEGDEEVDVEQGRQEIAPKDETPASSFATRPGTTRRSGIPRGP
jgi:hypothetical protein